MGFVYFVGLTIALLAVERIVGYKGSYRKRLKKARLTAARATS